jgi:hypothetical protein
MKYVCADDKEFMFFGGDVDNAQLIVDLAYLQISVAYCSHYFHWPSISVGESLGSGDVLVHETFKTTSVD